MYQIDCLRRFLIYSADHFWHRAWSGWSEWSDRFKTGAWWRGPGPLCECRYRAGPHSRAAAAQKTFSLCDARGREREKMTATAALLDARNASEETGPGWLWRSSHWHRVIAPSSASPGVGPFSWHGGHIAEFLDMRRDTKCQVRDNTSITCLMARQPGPPVCSPDIAIRFFFGGKLVSGIFRSQTGSHSPDSVLARANIMQISPTMQT